MEWKAVLTSRSLVRVRPGEQDWTGVSDRTACFFVPCATRCASWAILWMMPNGGLKAGTTRSRSSVEQGRTNAKSAAQFQAFTPKFCDVVGMVTEAETQYCDEVRRSTFTDEEHCYPMLEGEEEKFSALVGRSSIT